MIFPKFFPSEKTFLNPNYVEFKFSLPSVTMIQVQKQNERELVFPHIVSCESKSLRFGFERFYSPWRTYITPKFIIKFSAFSITNGFNNPYIFICFIIMPSRNFSSCSEFLPIFHYHKSMRKHTYINLSFLNNNSKNSNRENLNFASQLFSDEKSDIICVKEFAYGSPKFFPSEKTFLNANSRADAQILNFCYK